MQRPNEQQQRLSSWAINYRSPQVVMTLVDRMEYADMRSAIADIMGTNSTEGDEILLDEYNKCEFYQFRPKYHLHLSVVCGNISSTPTREMFLEDWLSSYNVTDINENVNKTRMKRQVDPGISTEQYRSGVTLTYTCGVARRFQNSTDLYDERYVVKYLNEKFLLNTKGPLSASGTRVGHQASSWIPVSGYSWNTLNTICIMYQYISITSYPTTWYR